MKFKLLMITFLALTARLCHAACPAGTTQVGVVSDLTYDGVVNKRIYLNNLGKLGAINLSGDISLPAGVTIDSVKAKFHYCIYFFLWTHCGDKSEDLDVNKITALLNNQDQIDEEVKEMLEQVKDTPFVAGNKINLYGAYILVNVGGYSNCLALPEKIYIQG